MSMPFPPIGSNLLFSGYCVGTFVWCAQFADERWAFSYWEAESGLVTEVEEADEDAMDGVDEDDE